MFSLEQGIFFYTTCVMEKCRRKFCETYPTLPV